MHFIFEAAHNIEHKSIEEEHLASSISPAGLTRQSACTIPCDLIREGLPVGLEFVGPMFGAALVLSAAQAHESVRPIPKPTNRGLH